MALAILSSSCGSDDDSGAGCAIANERCDIATPACQRAVLRATACERGETSPPPLPPVRMITPGEFRQELESAPASDDPTSSQWEQALQALRLVPATTGLRMAAIDAEVDGVAAYYDADSAMLTIISGSTADDALSRMYVLSHELVHYLQDLQVDLKSYGKDDPQTDSHLSVSALVEGEAVMTSTRALVHYYGNSNQEPLWAAFYAELDQATLDAIDQADAKLITAALTLPYAIGARYVGLTWETGRPAVDALFRARPTSLIDWIAGGRMRRTGSLVEPLDCGTPEPPQGYSIVGADRLGPAGVVALLATTSAPSLSTAASLRSDRLTVYAQGAQVLAAWRLRFANTAVAAQVAAQATGLTLTARVFDREVLITAAASGVNPLTGGALDACPNTDSSQAPNAGMPEWAPLVRPPLPPLASLRP